MRKRVAKFARRTILFAILLGAIVWVVDWLVLRNRATAYGEVEVRYQISIHMKNKRIEQEHSVPQMVECVHSMFSHYDDPPCWYLARHPDQAQDLDGRGWHFWYGDQ